MPHKKEKERFIALLLAGLFLLAACSAPGAELPMPTPTPEPTPIPKPTPEPTEEVKELWGFPIDDTHDAFEVPTGGRLGIVLVTVEVKKEGEEEYISTVSVWDTSDLTKPIQTMEEVGATTHHRECLDVNFDGYIDFVYTWAHGGKNDNLGLYIWDEKQGHFATGENFLGHLEIDKEKETVCVYSNGAGSSGIANIFRWENGKMSCVRRIEIHYPKTEGEKITQLLTVENCVNGEWSEIHRETLYSESDIYEEAALWHDLDYHGE